MSINLRRLRPGEHPSPSDWNRLVELVEQLTRVSGSGDTEISLSQTGLQIYDNRPSEHWARIIRRPDSHEDGESPVGNKYAHVQVDVDEDGTATDLPAASGFIWGEPDYLPAIEVNESGDVPDGQVVRLVPSRVGPWFEFDASGDQNTYLLAADSTPDEDGRFTSNEDTYDPDTDEWTTSGTDVLGEPAVGITMQKGLRYPARATSDPTVFTTIADANEAIVESVPVYFGGMVNTEMQVFKGIKEHRSETVWRRGKDEYAYIQNGAYPGTGSDANPNRNFQAKSLWVGKAGSSTEVGDYSASASINVGGTMFSHGLVVETQANTVSWARAQCDVYQGFDTQAGYARTIVSNGSGGIASLYALGKHGFIQLGATGSLYSSAGGPGVWTGLITVDEGTYNIQRGTVLVGIDKVYDPTTHGQIIAGGIVVDTWELSKGAPSSPPAPGTASPPEPPPEPPAEQIITYDCVDGVCVNVEGTGGAYATLADCMESSGCNPAGFYCTGAGCLYSSIYFGGSGDFGPYGTPEECEAACPPPDKAWYQVCPIGGVGSAACEYLTEDEATARGITAGPFETETACDEAFPAICSG